MSLSSVQDALRFYGTDESWSNHGLTVTAFTSEDEQRIRDLVTALYNGSTTARGILETAAQSGPIRIGEATPDDIAFFVPVLNSQDVPYLGYSFPGIDGLYYINDRGKLVKEVPILTIIHEFSHYVGTRHPGSHADPAVVTQMNGTDFDFDGDTVRDQNNVARELGLLDNIQVSYQSGIHQAVAEFLHLTVGHSYSNGEVVDIVRPGFDHQSDILDNSNRVDHSRDLLFGFDGSDVLKGGGGRDFLYGGSGNDELWGGADNDQIYGELGNDLLLSGSGSDFVDGGDGTDRIDLQLEISAGGAAFSVGGIEPAAGDPRPCVDCSRRQE